MRKAARGKPLPHSVLTVGPMKITLHRTDAKRYWTDIQRNDGRRFEIRGIGFMGAVPHDLAHFVVETELGLANGFWGTVAAGGVVGSMTATGGRRPFHADAKSAAVLKTNQADLNDAELLVGAFTEALEMGLPTLLMMLHRFQKGSAIKGVVVGDDEAVRVLERLRQMQRKWQEMPIEGELTLVWQAPTARRAPRKRA
jgi:hypothetical protein